MAISTPAGRVSFLTASTRSRTSLATAMALVLLRLATEMVTADWNWRLGVEYWTICVGSAASSVTVATSSRWTLLAMTRRLASAAVRKRRPASSLISRRFSVVWPAGRSWFAWPRARSTWSGLRLRAASLAGSSVMRSSRRRPPRSFTSDTSGVWEMVSWSWAAMRRRVASSYLLECNVSARMGTSSIARGLTMGGVAPAGMRSKLAWSFWLRLTMERS